MADNNRDYYLIVREPGRKLVAVEGTGADRGVFWQKADAENTATLLSITHPEYQYDIHHVGADDRIKGVIACYKRGDKVS